jgi:hypothetical protein
MFVFLSSFQLMPLLKHWPNTNFLYLHFLKLWQTLYITMYVAPCMTSEALENTSVVVSLEIHEDTNNADIKSEEHSLPLEVLSKAL